MGNCSIDSKYCLNWKMSNSDSNICSIKMFLKKAMIRKAIKSQVVRKTAKFGIKLVLTEKFLKNHKHLGKIVDLI